MKIIISSLLILMTSMFMNNGLWAQSSLPKEVQADLKQEEIISALKQKDFNRANDLFTDYDEIGVEMPPPLMLMRAQVSFQLKEYFSAQQNLEEYLAISDRGSDNYKKALKMLSTLRSKPELVEINEFRDQQLGGQFCKDLITIENFLLEKEDLKIIGHSSGIGQIIKGQFLESRECTPDLESAYPSVVCSYGKQKDFNQLIKDKVKKCVSAVHGADIKFQDDAGAWEEAACGEKIEGVAFAYVVGKDSMRHNNLIVYRNWPSCR